MEKFKEFSGKAESWAVNIETGETWRMNKPEILKNYIITDSKKTYLNPQTWGNSYDLKFIYYVKPRHIDATQQKIL